MVFGSLAWIGLAKLGETSTSQDIETKQERVILKDLIIENIENELNEKVAAPISVVTSMDNVLSLQAVLLNTLINTVLVSSTTTFLPYKNLK